MLSTGNLCGASVAAGVESAAAVNYLPLGGSNSSDSFLVEGVPEPPPGQEFMGRYRNCTPDYFHTMGIPVLKGRPFTDQDKAGSPPVIIVNETMAQKYWPGVDPIGRRVRFNAPLTEAPWMQVVGVVQDVKHELQTPVTSDYYLPHAQDVWSSMVLVARTKVEPMTLADEMRQQGCRLIRTSPSDGRTMKEVRRCQSL